MAPGRNTSLDSLRGLAALSVIFYHGILFNNELGLSLLTPRIQDVHSSSQRLLKFILTMTNGHNAVVLFFVLSGFVLMLSMQRDWNRGDWSWLSFIVRRFMRLFPALIAAMLVCFAIGLVAGMFGVTEPKLVAAASPLLVLKNMVLWDIGLHGATWTIQVEALAVPFLLVGFWMTRAFGAAGIVFCLAMAMLEIQKPTLTRFSPELTQSLFAFYVGMLAAKLTLTISGYVSKASAVGLMAALYLFPSLFFSLDSTVLLFVQVLASAGLIVCIYSAPSGIVTNILNSRQLTKIGRVSYSLYLLHLPILWAVYVVLARFGLSGADSLLGGLLIGLITTAIALPLADLFERYIEAPCNLLGKRLTSTYHLPAPDFGQAASEQYRYL